MPTFTVERAEVVSLKPDGKYGPMKTISLILDDSGQQKAAEWFTKDSTPVPSPGATVEGDLTYDEKWGWKFKKAYNGGANGGGGFKRSPADTRAIQRQHSQAMALQAIGLLGKPKDGDALRAALKAWTDWFDEDIPGNEVPPRGNDAPMPRVVPQRVDPGPSDIPADKTDLPPIDEPIGAASDDDGLPF